MTPCVRSYTKLRRLCRAVLTGIGWAIAVTLWLSVIAVVGGNVVKHNQRD